MANIFAVGFAQNPKKRDGQQVFCVYRVVSPNKEGLELGPWQQLGSDILLKTYIWSLRTVSEVFMNETNHPQYLLWAKIYCQIFIANSKTYAQEIDKSFKASCTHFELYA